MSLTSDLMNFTYDFVTSNKFQLITDRIV